MFRLFKKIELLLDIGGTHTHTWMLIRAGLPVVSFVSFLSLFSPPLPKRRRRRFGHVHHVSTDPPNETSLEGMKKLITNFCWKRKSSPGWLLRSPCRMLFGPRLPETSLLKKTKRKENHFIFFVVVATRAPFPTERNRSSRCQGDPKNNRSGSSYPQDASSRPSRDRSVTF